MTFVAGVARLAVAVFLLAVALDWRSPTLVGLRPWVLAGLVAGPFCLILAEIWTLEQLPEKWTPVFRRKCDQATSLAWRLRSRIVGALSVSTLALAAMALLSTVVAEGHFQWMRQQVLGADPRQLERLGRHVIVGYRDADEIRALTERRAIAGVFLAARNVTGRSVAEIRQEI